MGETPFSESPRDVLVGLVETVRALHKEIAPTKVGEKPIIQGKERADVLEGLVEEVRALRKEVAPSPTRETYAERLKKDLPSLSSLPSLLPSSTSSPSSRSSTSTRSKKKQL